MGSRWKILKQVCDDYGLDIDELSKRYNVSMPICKKKKEIEYVEMEEYMCTDQVYLVDKNNYAYLEDKETGMVNLVGLITSDGSISLIESLT